jgi:lysozyme
MNFDLLTSTLVKAEGIRYQVYDDATGQPIKPGSHVIGHPTIGVGRALDVKGISPVEVSDLLLNDMHAIADALHSKLKWFDSLDDTRQVILASMAFQMGVDGLLGFKNMLAAIERGDYATAGAEMLDSAWAKQTPSRAQHMAEAMRTGVMSNG